MEFMLWIWVAFLVVTVIVEFTTVQMVSIWFTFGSVAALIGYAAKAPYWAQIIMFVVVSLFFLVSCRKICMKWVLKNIKTKTNSDALVGLTVVLIDEISADSYGSAKFRDITWTAAGRNGFVAKAGDHVKIVDMEGNKIVVDSLDSTIVDYDEIKKPKNKLIAKYVSRHKNNQE